MRYLLDTNVLIHSMEGTLSVSMARILGDTANDLVVSMASLWETAIKSGLGKLKLPLDMDQQMLALGIELLPIERAHIAEYKTLPLLHRDPFDRMLIAQARVENLTLASSDRQFRRYDVKVLSA
ncbi:type II toxin-antitoxin system VapC family toxin [Ferrovibrio sp.]|uniref:type II toxin-antitoxin system VapC family toxin n=1 Tax=Ferrovibrio sp. TaxID=1917215 RepID=UPI0025BE9E08|nr:type II toxin-antitoxin system VapC family toxin [Ferrovibrio sp.]MBX3453481.1 type II toxin-antitoxin system VapC family toxin [Ferrovibrio sp.]